MTQSAKAVDFTALKSALVESNSTGSSPEVRQVVGTVIADIRQRGDARSQGVFREI